MRWFLSLLACSGAFVAPAIARAVEPTRLVLTRAPAAAKKCPDGEKFKALVDARMHKGNVPWSDEATQVVRVAFLDSGGLFAFVEIENAGEPRGHRGPSRVPMAHCPEVAEDLALAIAIAIDRLDATPDFHTLPEDETLSVPPPGVLGNDDRGATVIAVLDTAASHGLVSLGRDGGFTYIPDENYAGSDFFRYHASSSGTRSNTVTVTIGVTAVNDPPVAYGDERTFEDSLLRVPRWSGVLDNDVDPDSARDALRVELVADAVNGLLSLQEDGSFTYTPVATASTSDRFTYRVHDESGASNIATVILTKPRARNPSTEPLPRPPPGPIVLYAGAEGGFSYWSGGSEGADKSYQSTVTSGDVAAGGGTTLGRGYSLDVAVAGFGATKRDRRSWRQFDQRGRDGRPPNEYVKENLAATAMRVAVRSDSEETGVSLGVLVGGFQETGCRHDRTGVRNWASPLCTEEQQWAAFPTFALRLGPVTGPYATLGFLDGRMLAGSLAHLGAGLILPRDLRAELTIVASTEGIGPRLAVAVPLSRHVVLLPSIGGGLLYDSLLLGSNGRNSSWLRAGTVIAVRQ